MQSRSSGISWKNLQRCWPAQNTPRGAADRPTHSVQRPERTERKLVKPDEEIVGALPGNERVMSKRHDARGVFQGRCRNPPASARPALSTPPALSAARVHLEVRILASADPAPARTRAGRRARAAASAPRSSRPRQPSAISAVSSSAVAPRAQRRAQIDAAWSRRGTGTTCRRRSGGCDRSVRQNGSVVDEMMPKVVPSRQREAIGRRRRVRFDDRLDRAVVRASATLEHLPRARRRGRRRPAAWRRRRPCTR